MDKLILPKMSFYAYHGVFPEEKTLGQVYELALTMELDLQIAGNSDRLEDTINYAEVFSGVKTIVEGQAATSRW